MVLQKNSIQIIENRKFIACRNMVKPTKNKINVLKNEIKQYFDKNGYLSWSSKKKMYIILGTNIPKDGLVECPQCRLGKIIMIRSNTTKKRFLGCSNYYNGCRASSPLLQKAKVLPTKTPCYLCSWPMILFRYSRKQKWIKQCSNIKCSSRNSKI